LTMLIAAFEIDQQVGSKLGPVLRSAAATLDREFELNEETRAEVAQTRSEFYIVTGIILFICIYMFTIGGKIVDGAFSTPLGISVLTIFALNFAWGVFRITRILSKAKGSAL
jgi:Flp pilus assembly protein TadB